MKEGTPNIASIFYNNSVQNINDFSPTYKNNVFIAKIVQGGGIQRPLTN